MSQVPFFDLSKQIKGLAPELEAAFQKTLDSSEFILGAEVKKFETAFAGFVGSRYAVGVNSGLDALSLSLRALGIGPGDEVILEANTFIATALAVTAVGATPVFVDADPDYLLIDLKCVKAALSPKTKAVIPVHLYGQPVDMEPLLNFCREKGIFCVEDACQAHGASIRGRLCGTFGELGCFSFYPGKNLGAFGDGGLITTNHAGYYEKLLCFRNYGSVVKYEHPVCGFNTRLDNLQAAFLNVKLTHLSEWNLSRNKLASRYFDRLSAIPGIVLPKPRKDFYCVYHLYVVRTKEREALKTFLQKRGIGTSIHYPVPIHKLGAYRDLPHRIGGDLSVCETEAGRILSLPMFPEMTEAMVDGVCDAIRDFFKS